MVWAGPLMMHVSNYVSAKYYICLVTLLGTFVFAFTQHEEVLITVMFVVLACAVVAYVLTDAQHDLKHRTCCN